MLPLSGFVSVVGIAVLRLSGNWILLAAEGLHIHRHPYRCIPWIENDRLGLVLEGKFTVFNVGYGFYEEHLQFVWD